MPLELLSALYLILTPPLARTNLRKARNLVPSMPIYLVSQKPTPSTSRLCFTPLYLALISYYFEYTTLARFFGSHKAHGHTRQHFTDMTGSKQGPARRESSGDFKPN